LVYATPRGRLLGVEVATAYYDEQDARTRWGPARGHEGGRWVGRDLDQGLARFINKVLADKCAKSYDFPAACILVIDARLPLTDEWDIRRTVLSAMRVPTALPYAEIYLAGQYRIWRLYPSGRRGGAPVPGSGFPVP
jgi:hypothetical protein